MGGRSHAVKQANPRRWIKDRVIHLGMPPKHELDVGVATYRHRAPD